MAAWTPEDDNTLRAHHAAGRSLHWIAQEMGRGKATISNKAKALGLAWDRAQVASATVAKVRDAKARRADALLAELEILERSQQRVLVTLRGDGPWSTIVRGEGGAENARALDFVPPRDLRDETSARASMAVVIDRLHTDDNGATEARSMLARLADSLGVKGSEQ